ncbi:NADAR family protein [Pseudoalteromonas sp. ACER1]|jgi:ribA/ribD-fused uncharacterized protein|uniref:NADAR family protein n=1 Tax=unclassified Pseudoalteromonas TaxID=194690 RepID=UPI001F164649|nr:MULTISPECIES: NADAR family protein [unclassified Pseudoalteromonas]MCF2849183.1 NADAR family protein [Pseudoalteromonas sp. PAST1]MCO7212657.1 NADAR family protein [Pseudoalteromonas sp. ACER1]
MLSKAQGEGRPLRSYSREDAVVFNKTKEAFGGLSNMASGYPLLVNGVDILTSEALYQACRFPHNPKLQQVIVQQLSPMNAKKRSWEHLQDSRGDWNEVRHMVMRWCLHVKLAQNYDEFGELLLSTRDYPIVELSWKDDFWGARPMDNNESVLVGQNVLGRLLMELREKLKLDTTDRLRSVPPMKIQDFMLFGRTVETVRPVEGKGGKPQAELF